MIRFNAILFNFLKEINALQNRVEALNCFMEKDII